MNKRALAFDLLLAGAILTFMLARTLAAPNTSSRLPEARRGSGTVTCTTFNSGDTPQSIPDNNVNGAVSVIAVSTLTGEYVHSLTYTVNISHAAVESLDAYLLSPLYGLGDASFWYAMLKGGGQTGANITNAIFSAAGASTIDNGSAPYTGTWNFAYTYPDDLFPQDGLEANGNWQFKVADRTAGTTGSLTDWSLTLCTSTLAPATRTPTPTPTATGTPWWSESSTNAFSAGAAYEFNPFPANSAVEHYDAVKLCLDEGESYDYLSSAAALIKPDTTWTIGAIEMFIGWNRDIGAPAPGKVLEMRVYADAGGDVGALVGTGTIITTAICDVYEDNAPLWGCPVRAAFSPALVLTADQTYWVVPVTDVLCTPVEKASRGGRELVHEPLLEAVTSHDYYGDPSPFPAWVEGVGYCGTLTGGVLSGCSTDTADIVPIALYAGGAPPTPSRAPYTAATPTATATFPAYLTPGPTPTPDPQQPPKIIGVYPCQGTPCNDWNLRSGCGLNDLWVDVTAGTWLDSLVGYEIGVTDASGTLTCSHTFAADVAHIDVKTTFLDEMLTPDETPCLSWPETGTVVLYDPDDVLIDSVSYSLTGVGP